MRNTWWFCLQWGSLSHWEVDYDHLDAFGQKLSKEDEAWVTIWVPWAIHVVREEQCRGSLLCWFIGLGVSLSVWPLLIALNYHPNRKSRRLCCLDAWWVGWKGSAVLRELVKETVISLPSWLWGWKNLAAILLLPVLTERKCYLSFCTSLSLTWISANKVAAGEIPEPLLSYKRV